MSYSSGPGGYGGPPQGPQGPSTPGYGPQSQAYGAAPGPSEAKGLPFYFNIGVIALGVLNFFVGFAPYAKINTSGIDVEIPGASSNFFQNIGIVSISLLLAAAVIAGLGMLPKQSINEVTVSGLSLVGFLSALFQLIAMPQGMSVGLGLILVLVLSFLQSALAIAALLFTSGIIKPPQPSQPQYGYYGPGGGYGQPPQSQPQQQQPYYGGGPGPGSYQQPPPSQPPQQHNQW